MSVLAVSTHAHADDRGEQVVIFDKATTTKKQHRRFKGTGIRSRQLASPGARHRVNLAQLQMRIAPQLAVRGGAGMATLRPQGFLPETRAAAIAAGASLTLWQNDSVQLDVDVNTVRAGYAAGALADTTVMLALRNH